MGEPLPVVSSFVFHFTFSVSDHVSTNPLPAARPWPEGPRQRGQYFAPSPSTAIIATSFTGRSAACGSRNAARARATAGFAHICMAHIYQIRRRNVAEGARRRDESRGRLGTQPEGTGHYYRR